MPLDIGIDMGTANTIIYANGAVVLQEPSVVVTDSEDGRPLNFGAEAFKMMGRTSDKMTVIKPIEHGVIANHFEAESMLRYFLKKIGGNRMIKPRIMIAMPAGITAVQQRSFIYAVQEAGARNICPIESPVAAALGMGIDFTKPYGTIVVDIGAGSTDVAVLSMGGLAQSESVRIASSDFDEAIIKYVRKKYSVAIGAKTAERIKMHIGSAVHRPIEITMKAKGLNFKTGLPQVFELTANEICDAISDVSYGICKAVQVVLEKTPPELVGDIAKDGILLTGGGALLGGMCELFERYMGVKTTLSENPLESVARGIGVGMKNFDLLKNGDYEFKSLIDIASK